MYYYSKSPAVSKFGLSLVPLNPSTFNRVYIIIVGKVGILVRSRYRDGPAVAGAAIVMHYCIMSLHNRGSLPAFSQFLPPVAWVCRLFEILCSYPCRHFMVRRGRWDRRFNYWILHEKRNDYKSLRQRRTGKPILQNAEATSERLACRHTENWRGRTCTGSVQIPKATVALHCLLLNLQKQYRQRANSTVYGVDAYDIRRS